MMKRWISLLFVLMLLPAMALADGGGVEWSDIAALINRGESGVVNITDLDDTSIILSAVKVKVNPRTSTYTISTHPDYLNQGRATISGVQIDARDTAAHRFYVKPSAADGIEEGIMPSAAGTYVFEDIVIDGDVSVFAYEWCDVKMKNPEDQPGNQVPVPGRSSASHYAVRLKESVVLSEGAQVDIRASDSVTMDKYGTERHRFHGGSVDFEMDCSADDVDLMARCGGEIDAKIGAHANSIGFTSYNGSDVSLHNLAAEGEQGAQSGSVYVTLSDKSKGELINERELESLLLECVVDSKLTAENDADVGMLEFHTEVDSQIKFTNDGVIKNSKGYDGNSWGDQAVVITIDETSRLNLSGKGTIMPGYQWFDYYLGSPEMHFKTPKPGASVIIDLSESSFELDSYAENVEMARKVAKRVSFDWDQIERGRKGFTWELSDSSEAPPHSVLAVFRDERAFIWPVTKNNVYYPVLKDKEELDILPMDYEDTGEERADEPKVLLGGVPDKSTDIYLNVADEQEGRGRVRYELRMIDAWGSDYDPGKKVELYLPYPDVDSPETREYEVHHTCKDGTVEYYSTQDGTIRKLENGRGMVMEIRSFSPFELVWAQDAAVPSTGDDSRPALWLTLACAACIALASRRRKAA